MSVHCAEEASRMRVGVCCRRSLEKGTRHGGGCNVCTWSLQVELKLRLDALALQDVRVVRLLIVDRRQLVLLPHQLRRPLIGGHLIDRHPLILLVVVRDSFTYRVESLRLHLLYGFGPLTHEGLHQRRLALLYDVGEKVRLWYTLAS